MDFSVFSDEHYMKLAYQQALRAKDQGEIPVGAVVVCGQKVVAKAHNQTETLQDVTAHAEILAITSAANYLGAKYLTECTLFVTLEPCPMCAGAIFWSQLKRLVYGASDPGKGYNLYSKSRRVEHTDSGKTKSVQPTAGTSHQDSTDGDMPPTSNPKSSGGLLHPRTEVVKGLMAEPCARLVEDFFRELRN